jgi:hypothetical protein
VPPGRLGCGKRPGQHHGISDQPVILEQHLVGQDPAPGLFGDLLQKPARGVVLG